MKKILQWWKQILITLGILGVASASMISVPSEQLKAPKTDIMWSNEYTKVERSERGEIISQKQTVNYAYKSDEKVPPLKDEIIEKRTQNIVTFNLGGKKRAAQSGHNFYQENGQWKKVKFATTTPEVFNQASLWNRALAADTGATSPGTMADDATMGTATWSNVDNAKASNGSYASVVLDNDEDSHYINATNFGFSIPTGATINGIKVEIEKKGTRNNGGVYDATDSLETDGVILRKGGSITGNGLGFFEDLWPESDAYVSYGDSTNLWGATFTPSDINSSDFGVSQAAWAENIESGTNTAYVDHMRITVYYTEGGGGDGGAPLLIPAF